MEVSTVYIWILLGSVILRALVDIWELALERFFRGVYVTYTLECRACQKDPAKDRSFEYSSSSPHNGVAWSSMREHYIRQHPEQLWRVGRLPRGHSPAPR